jgi:hypothetical protein
MVCRWKKVGCAKAQAGFDAAAAGKPVVSFCRVQGLL